jgi:hypothetical protein
MGAKGRQSVYLEVELQSLCRLEPVWLAVRAYLLTRLSLQRLARKLASRIFRVSGIRIFWGLV